MNNSIGYSGDNLIAYRTVDKSGWQRGPWDDEPDKIQWTDQTTGLPCLIVRGPHGSLCGYVGVPKWHPWHGADYDTPNVDVHGGLTFARACGHGDEATGICHVPAPGEPDDVWWFGFDCAHAGDLTSMAFPEMTRGRLRWPLEDHDVYRDVAYVRDQVAGLAAQCLSRLP